MTTEQSAPALDDQDGMQIVDRRNVRRLVRELPEQCETALGIGRSIAIEPLSVAPNVVLFSGVGDSALAGDMAAAVLAEDIGAPVVSDHGSRLPACVGEQSLVIVTDYSGRSQAVLRNYREAKSRGATVVCLSGGGRLAEMAARDGTKIVRIPSDQPSRFAIGYLFVPLVAIIESLGLVSGSVEKLSYGIRLMKNVRESIRVDTPTARNLAKQLAGAFLDKTPVIYGVSGYRACVANRWRSQIAANSKAPAISALFPDLADGEISAWDAEGRSPANPVFVFLTDPLDKATEIRALMGAAKDRLDKLGVIEVEMNGSTTVQRMLHGIYLGDFVSYYLAMLYETDPEITESVACIRSQLAERPRSPAAAETPAADEDVEDDQPAQQGVNEPG